MQDLRRVYTPYVEERHIRGGKGEAQSTLEQDKGFSCVVSAVSISPLLRDVQGPPLGHHAPGKTGQEKKEK